MIIVRIWEGLGNQLFQYAYAKALQLMTGEKVYIDTSEYSRDVLREYGLNNFRISLPCINYGHHLFNYIDSHNCYKILKEDIKQLPYGFPICFGKEKHIEFKSALLNPKGNWYLKGWFQNERYFARCQDVIRKEIRPVNKIKISSELREMLEREGTVAIHFRRSDYLTDGNVLNQKYYKKAISIIEEKVQNPCYLVFSDEIDWVRRNIDLGENFYYVNEDRTLKDYEELMVMSKCRHNIIANSTFSWWGAWLNNNSEKIVVAPKIWFLYDRCLKTHIVPGGWIQI